MKNRRQWIAMLAKLTAPMESTAAAQAFAAYLPMLADFPDDVFCEASLQAVAAKVGPAPPYGILRKALGDWSKQHGPKLVELPAPPSRPRQPPDDFERKAVSRSVREILTGFSEVTRQREAQLPQHALRLDAKPLSREQLNIAYRSAGLAGPQLPAKLRTAAADIRPEVKRGPP